MQGVALASNFRIFVSAKLETGDTGLSEENGRQSKNPTRRQSRHFFARLNTRTQQSATFPENPGFTTALSVSLTGLDRHESLYACQPRIKHPPVQFEIRKFIIGSCGGKPMTDVNSFAQEFALSAELSDLVVDGLGSISGTVGTAGTSVRLLNEFIA
ncbi:MAG: hypothetical protein AAF231_03600 [Pseudomonadota bacterium]